MSNGTLKNVTEVFSSPIESLIVALGRGIAEAQTALDRNSIQAQQELDADPVLSSHGLQATWYQFPKVDLELKLALTVVEEGSAPQAPATRAGLALSKLPAPHRLVAQPVSAAYQNHFNYNAAASSTIRLSIVPVPPPRSGDQSALPPRLSTAEVQKAALASPAKFQTAKDSDGGQIPAPSLRFDINFNGAAQLWYVLQYDASNPDAPAVVVTVDDRTGVTRVIST
jgi:hypothetical protein